MEQQNSDLLFVTAAVIRDFGIKQHRKGNNDSQAQGEIQVTVQITHIYFTQRRCLTFSFFSFIRFSKSMNSPISHKYKSGNMFRLIP